MKKADLCTILGAAFTLSALLYFVFPILATALNLPSEQYANTYLTLTAFATLIAGLRFWGAAKY